MQIYDPTNVCVIDDDDEFSIFLVDYLTANGVPAVRYRSAEEVLRSEDLGNFDFFVVDLGLPGLDGVDLIAMIRARNQSGVLVVSGRLGPDSFITALAAGADMVINKPVRFDQILQAIRSICRRVGKVAKEGKRQHWTVLADYTAMESPGGQSVPLTPVEGRLLRRLQQAGQTAVSRADLTEAAGISGPGDGRNLDATIFRLRRKIERDARCPAPLRTAHGVGYQLTEAIEVVAESARL